MWDHFGISLTTALPTTLETLFFTECHGNLKNLFATEWYPTFSEDVLPMPIRWCISLQLLSLEFYLSWINQKASIAGTNHDSGAPQDSLCRWYWWRHFSLLRRFAISINQLHLRTPLNPGVLSNLLRSAPQNLVYCGLETLFDSPFENGKRGITSKVLLIPQPAV